MKIYSYFIVLFLTVCTTLGIEINKRFNKFFKIIRNQITNNLHQRFDFYLCYYCYCYTYIRIIQVLIYVYFSSLCHVNFQFIRSGGMTRKSF